MIRSLLSSRLRSTLVAVVVFSVGCLVASPASVARASILTDADDQTQTPDAVAALPGLEPLPDNFLSALDPDSGGGGGGGGSSRPPGSPLPGVPASLAGTDRVATAIAVAEADFQSSGLSSAEVATKLVARAGVLASSASFPDALTAGPLAFAKVAPLLLTGRDALDPRVSDALSRLVPRGATLFIVGGEAAISPNVVAQAEQLGYVVRRLAGSDRYETALSVARDGIGNPAAVFVATGVDFPDALAAGAVASRREGAVVLTQGDVAPSSLSSYLRTLEGVAIHAVGGPAVRALADAGIAATAHQGTDRYATATALASAFPPLSGLVGVASGEVFPDGLVAAPYLARRGSVLVLVSTGGVPAPTVIYLRGRGGVNTLQVFGGLNAVSDAIRRSLSDLL